MPIYVYNDLITGEQVELLMPIDERDSVPSHLERITAPQRIGVVQGLANPSDVDEAVPVALKQMEESIGLKEMERQSGFCAKTLKKVWC